MKIIDNDPALKTSQFAHQRDVYLEHRTALYYALFWEMGLGKTKELIDVASHLFLTNRIQGLLIVAPNAVYSNWTNEELPTHMAVPYINLLFKSSSKGEKAKMRRALFLNPNDWHGKLRVLCMSYDALRTEHGYQLAMDFTLLYKSLIVADESTAIKNPKTENAKRMKKVRAQCHYAWIATGTPIADKPFDIHSQIEFLAPDFWKNHGLKSREAFKTQFGVFEQRRAGMKVFSVVVGYKETDRLQSMIKSISSRLLKEDSTVKLPPKVYKTITFELSEKQRRAYDELRKQYLTELEGGGVVEAPLAFVRLTRLQQIASGFVTVEKRDESTSCLGSETPIARGSRAVCGDCGLELDVRPDGRLPVHNRLVADADDVGLTPSDGKDHAVNSPYRPFNALATMLTDNGSLFEDRPELYDVAMSALRPVSKPVTVEHSNTSLALADPEFDDLMPNERLAMQLSYEEAFKLGALSQIETQQDTTWAAAEIQPKQSVREVVDVVSADENPRLKVLVELIEQATHKVIVWCRFTRDVENVCAVLGEIAVRYDGKTNRDLREESLRRFKDPNDSARVFVANVHSISQGVTLVIAKTMIYYTNSFSPEKRLQSEDRFHRIGQDQSVLIIDLVAMDTVDVRLIDGLRKKYEISAAVMGDRYREWLQPINAENELSLHLTAMDDQNR